MQEHAERSQSSLKTRHFADYVDTYRCAAVPWIGPLIIGAILIAIFFIQKAARAEKLATKFDSQYAQAKAAAQTAAKEIRRNYETFREPPTYSVQVCQPVAARRASAHRGRWQSKHTHPGNSVFRKRVLSTRNEGHCKRKLLCDARNARANKVHSTPTCVYRRHEHHWRNWGMAQIAIEAHTPRLREGTGKASERRLIRFNLPRVRLTTSS